MIYCTVKCIVVPKKNGSKELSIIRSTTNLFVILLKFNFVGIKNIKHWSQ